MAYINHIEKALIIVRALSYATAFSLFFFVFITIYDTTKTAVSLSGFDLILCKSTYLPSTLSYFALFDAAVCFVAFGLSLQGRKLGNIYFFLLSFIAVCCLLLLYVNIPISEKYIIETGTGYKLSIAMLALAGCLGFFRHTDTDNNKLHVTDHTTLNINIITQKSTENKSSHAKNK